MGDVAPENPESALQLRRACAELIRQLRAGGDARSETFLASFAAHAQDADSAIELIYTEFATREELGQQPRAEEFIARFPSLADALRRQLDIHAIVGGAVDEPADVARLSAESREQLAAMAGELLAPQRQIGGFRVLAEMARGAMGVVYKAQHCELGRIVALKLLPGLPGGGAPRSAVLQRFRDEARVMAALRHPNIVQIDEIGEDADGRPFLVCEFVDGGSLAEQLAAGKFLARPGAPQQAALLIRTLAEAVDCAHRLGILHCDLSPANVLLTADGTPKVADFGLARLRRDAAKLRPSSTIAGTPAYMAPEQWTRPDELSPATDVYALGAILYELLTGRPPFCGATAWETLSLASTSEPTAPRRVRPNISPDLEAICLKCLAKNPRQRYPTAARLAADLDRLLAGEPVAARPIGAAERMAKTARRRPLAAAALAIALAATTALVVGGWRYNTLLRTSLRQSEAQQHQIQDQAVELAAQLDASRRNVYAMQLNQSEMVLEETPQRAAEMLRDLRRCPADLRDFAWGLLYHRAAQDRQTLESADVRLEALVVPDANAVVGLDRTGQVLRWQTNRGRALARMRLPLSAFTCAALAPDGHLAALGGEDQAIYVCNIDRSPDDLVLRGHGDRITALAISPDCKHLLSGSRDGEVRLWNLGQRSSTRLCAPTAVAVAGVAFDLEGRRLATADAEGVIKVWTMPELKIEAEINTDRGGVLGIALAPDSDTLTVGALWDGRIDVWDLKTQRLRGSLKAEGTLLRAMAVSPDRKLLAAAAADQTIRLWDLKTMSGGEIFRRYTSQIDCLAFSGDGQILASADQDANVKLWDVGQSPSPRLLATSSARILATAFSPQGENLATAGFDPVVHVWDTASGRQRFALEGHESAVRSLRYSVSGKYLASAGEDGAVRLWDMESGKLHGLWQHPCWVLDVAFSPDDRLVATAASDGRVRLWTVEPWADHPLAEVGEHHGAVQAVSFSPRGRLLATAGRDAAVVLWDVVDRRRLATLAGHQGGVAALAFSPDGHRLASAGEDMQIRLWDVDARAPIAALAGHTQPIASLVFTPDGRTLASGTGDRWLDVPGEVKLWDVRTGHLHATIDDHGGPLALASGSELLATSQDAAIWLWQAVPYQGAVSGPAESSRP